MSPAITLIETSEPEPLAQCVKAAFDAAFVGNGTVDEGVLSMSGMSGRKYRLLINNLIKSVPDARYLEVGSWAGSTLCSAINGNKVRATAIDNWMEFGGPKDQFMANLQQFRTSDAQVDFIENDFRRVDFTALGKFNVYLFDGPHKAQDQYDGIALALPALDRRFVLIVDDWNHAPVRKGTLLAFANLGLSVLFSIEIRTTLDGSKPQVTRAKSEWHNGYFIGVCEKAK